MFSRPPFLLAVLAFLFSQVFAANYYVSPDGSDANPGTKELPWKSIAFATCGGKFKCPNETENPNLLEAGDTLFVREGRYKELTTSTSADRGIRFANSGREGSPIVITGYPGERAIVDGSIIPMFFIF